MKTSVQFGSTHLNAIQKRSRNGVTFFLSAFSRKPSTKALGTSWEGIMYSVDWTLCFTAVMRETHLIGVNWNFSWVTRRLMSTRLQQEEIRLLKEETEPADF